MNACAGTATDPVHNKWSWCAPGGRGSLPAGASPGGPHACVRHRRCPGRSLQVVEQPCCGRVELESPAATQRLLASCIQVAAFWPPALSGEVIAATEGMVRLVAKMGSVAELDRRLEKMLSREDRAHLKLMEARARGGLRGVACTAAIACPRVCRAAVSLQPACPRSPLLPRAAPQVISCRASAKPRAPVPVAGWHMRVSA